MDKKTAFIFSDLGDVEDLVSIFRDRDEKIFLLDHHEMKPGFDPDELPDNISLANPTLFQLDGLKEVAGATVNYLFAKEINRKITKHSWLGVLGIAGDSLMPIDQLRSLNRELYEEAKMEENTVEKTGLALLGASHETIKNALRLSILPFLPRFEGNLSKVSDFLKKIQVPGNKKAEFTSSEEIEVIQDNLGENITGSVATFPNHQGILRYAFEYAVTLNILGFHSKNDALRLLERRNITQKAKNLYYNYIENLVTNLSRFVKLPMEPVGSRALLMNVTNEIPKESWSDTASFASVNDLYDSNKILFVAGRENSKIKFSVRCNEKFLQENHFGVDEVIHRVIEKMGGQGGGHRLAGGYLISSNEYRQFKNVLSKVL